MVFDLLKSLFGGGVERPARRSPQGWQDRDPGWPGHGLGRQAFATPWDAVDAVESALVELVALQKKIEAEQGGSHETIARGQSQVQRYAAAMQALYIADRDMAERKGSYGRLAGLLCEHLPAVPMLVQGYPMSTQVSRLVEDLVDSGDEELTGEARRLDAVLEKLKS